MKLKSSERTYQASTIKEALATVRRDLGGDALILSTREIRRRWLFGLGARSLFEVKATDAASASGRRAGGAPVSQAGPRPKLKEGLDELHAVVDKLSSAGGLNPWALDIPSSALSVYDDLLRADIPEETARRLAFEVADRLEADPGSHHDPNRAGKYLIDAVAGLIATSTPIDAATGTRRVIALVGPTGVGKTTTIAKLAASAKVTHGLRVGLVTVDTYRIAAVEQLRTYADIIDVPLEVVEEPGRMRAAIAKAGDVDLILIDTAGRSPRDELKIRELAAFLNEAEPDEVHLVLSAAAAERTLVVTAERFAPARPDRLIFTKLDEADGLGRLLAVLERPGFAISHLTTGQAVPEDLERAEARRLARLIVGRETLGGGSP